MVFSSVFLSALSLISYAINILYNFVHISLKKHSIVLAKYIVEYRFVGMQHTISQKCCNKQALKMISGMTINTLWILNILFPQHHFHLYHSHHLVPCGNKPIAWGFAAFILQLKEKKYCICQLIIPDEHQLHPPLCLWAYFTSGKHWNSGRKSCLMDRNPVHYVFIIF